MEKHAQDDGLDNSCDRGPDISSAHGPPPSETSFTGLKLTIDHALEGTTNWSTK